MKIKITKELLERYTKLKAKQTFCSVRLHQQDRVACTNRKSMDIVAVLQFLRTNRL